MGGQTFAKYITTTETGTVQATVAKWGYVIHADASNMFSNKYAEAATNNGGTDDISVLATDAIVAPGTNGSMEITVEGKAEVDADVTFTTGSTEWKDVKLTDNTTPYYPILWTLTLEGESNPVTNGTLAEVESYFKTATFHYEAENYDAADASHVNLKYTLSWNWAFVYADTDEARHINDKYDTLLGAASANGLTESSETIDGNVHNYSYVTSISFNLGVSVTQAD